MDDGVSPRQAVMPGAPRVTGRRDRRFALGADRRGRSGVRTPRSCGPAPRAARQCCRPSWCIIILSGASLRPGSGARCAPGRHRDSSTATAENPTDHIRRRKQQPPDHRRRRARAPARRVPSPRCPASTSPTGPGGLTSAAGSVDIERYESVAGVQSDVGLLEALFAGIDPV